MNKKSPNNKHEFEDISLRKNDANAKFNNFTLLTPSHPYMRVYQSGHKHNTIPGWHTKLATYDHYIIHYVLSGKGIYRPSSRSYPIEKGDLFLIKPYESIDYLADLHDPWTYYWVGFNGHEVSKILKLCGYDDDTLVRSYNNDEELKEIFHKLAYPQMDSIDREYELLGNLYQMFSLLIHTSNPRPYSISERYLSLAMEYIQEHCTNPALQVTDVAAYVGIDRSYLYRIFNNALSQSVQDFILYYRLQKAQGLLKYSDHPVGLIALSCGFENQSYFSNIFKKHFHQTPLQYRKAQQQNPHKQDSTP